MLGGKKCTLDIDMVVDGKQLNIEVQVNPEEDYRERSIYYLARKTSLALSAGMKYRELPHIIMISILDFTLFDCEEFHSEYRMLDMKHHTPLTDKQALHFYELPKLPELPEPAGDDDLLHLWLDLFKMETEEDLQRIKDMEVPIMSQAILAYQHVSTSRELDEINRMLEKAERDEASRMYYAVEKERVKWERRVAEMEAENARLRAQLAGRPDA